MPRLLLIMVTGMGLLLTGSCRSRKPPPPPPEPVPELLTRQQLPRRGVAVSDFEHLAHWEVRSEAGGVELNKNLSQAVWGRASAEIRFTPRVPGPGRVDLVPAEPWIIPSQFDTILLWMLHDGRPGLREDHRIRLRYRDATGRSGEWVMPYSPSPEMQMLHLRVPEAVPSPVLVESLTWELPASSGGIQNLYLDSLSIYQEVLGSIPQTVNYVRPFGYAPIYAPRRRNSVTLNFPTREAAFRPQTRAGRSVQSLERLDNNTFLFSFENRDGQLGYRIRPEPGMPRVDVFVNGKELPGLWRHAAVETGGDIPELRYARMNEDRLLLQYTQGLQFELSLHGKTLQVEMNSLLENVKAYSLGGISAGPGRIPRVLKLPLMRIREDQRWPVFSIPDNERMYLVSCFPDWWYSLSSQYQNPPDFRGEGVPLGKMLYQSRWRGNRNMFRERIYFTVSEQLEDVLPSLSMPAAMYRREFGSWPWTGDASLPSMHLMSINPLDSVWEDRNLARDTRGEWRRHPVRGYLIKSALFDSIPMDRLRERAEADGGNSLEIPAVGMSPPWRFLDYDIRSIGGASYAQSFAETGALLQQAEAEWGGGIVSRGGSEWFWSGLVSAILPEFPLGIEELHPVLPQFAWRNVHPVTQILGLGELDDFRLPSDGIRDEEALLGRMLALQVAYGAAGRIPDLENPMLRTRSARIQAVLQPRFAEARAERIAYWSGEKFLDAGEALAKGVLQDSRLYIRLDSETEIWVNGSFFDNWEIRVDGRELSLPPFGFVVRGNDLLLIQLPRHGGRPGLCLLETPDQTWVSSPDRVVEALSMRLRGSLQVTRNGEGEVELDILDWHGEAGISNQLIQMDRIGTLHGIDSRGQPVRDLQFVREGEEWVLRSETRLRRVWISPEISGREMNFSP